MIIPNCKHLTSPGRLISRNGDIKCPVRSPDFYGVSIQKAAKEAPYSQSKIKLKCNKNPRISLHDLVFFCPSHLFQKLIIGAPSLIKIFNTPNNNQIDNTPEYKIQLRSTTQKIRDLKRRLIYGGRRIAHNMKRSQPGTV